MKYLFFLIPFLAKAQTIILLDSLTHQPIPSVLIENEKGELLTLSGEKGEVNLALLGETAYTSHLSFAPKKIIKNKLKNGQSLLLTSREYSLPEVIITKKPYDYTCLKSYIRTFVYSENTPLYYTEGWVDFYVPKKGRLLKYKIISLRCYENTKNEKLIAIKKGVSIAGSNGLINFLTTNYFPLDDKNYKLIPQEAGNFSISYRLQDGAGTIYKKGNRYSCTLNLLFPEKTKEGSFAGRKNTIHNIELYQEFPSYSDFNSLEKTDFISYRYLVNMDTSYKKKTINITSISEIYPVEQTKIRKEDLKGISLESFYGGMLHSVHIEKFPELEENIPINIPILQSLIGKDLTLIPE